MSNYEKFLKLLHEKGHVKAMTAAINLSPIETLPEEIIPLTIEGMIGSNISMILMKDPEAKEIFDKAACDLMLEKIFKDLDLKKDENFEPTSNDLLTKAIAESFMNHLFGNIFRK